MVEAAGVTVRVPVPAFCRSIQQPLGRDALAGMATAVGFELEYEMSLPQSD